MPYKDFGIADFNQASYFKSWARNNYGGLTRGYTTPSENTQAKGVTISGIPAGATITAYNVYFNVDTGLYGGTHTPASGASVNPSNISFYWKSSTGGSYPSYPTSNTGDSTYYQDKTGLLTRTGIYVRVTYTESGAPPPTGGFAISSAHIDAGQTLTASIVPADASYRHRIIYAHYGGANFYIADLDPGYYTNAYTIPMSFLNSIPNATRELCTATLYTISGDGLVAIGNTSINFYVYAPASVVPTLTGVTATLVSNGVAASITRYVQNYSKCLLEITGAAVAYESPISSYKITGGGFTVNAVSGTVGTFGTTGDLTFTATITDSRGRTASATVTITVDAYNLPSLTDISAFRCDVNGTADRAGAYVLLKATPAISPIGGQNGAAMTGRVYMRGGTPGTPESMTSNTASILGGGLLLPVKTYIAEIIVQDLINAYAYTATIPTDRVALHFLDSISAGAINKYAEIENAFEIAWPMLMLDGGPAAKYEIGDILITLNSTSPATRYPGTTWAAIAAGTFLVAAGTGYTAGDTGGEETHQHGLSAAYAKISMKEDTGRLYTNMIAASYNATYYLNTSAAAVAETLARVEGAAIGGTTDSGSSLPPYRAVYMWERTA